MLKAWRRLLGEVGEPAPAVGWPAVEAQFGTTLPVDYKLLADNYPALNIDNFLAVIHPVGGEDTDSLLEFVERVLGWFRARREDFSEQVPFPLWPEPGGLLPWGSTDNNDHVFWLTIGEPDRWPVVATNWDEWWVCSGGMQSFLVNVLNGGAPCPVFTEEFPGKDWTIGV